MNTVFITEVEYKAFYLFVIVRTIWTLPFLLSQCCLR